jgi:hypothetical protein
MGRHIGYLVPSLGRRLYPLRPQNIRTSGLRKDVANHQCSVRLRYRTRNCVHRLPSTRIRCHCLWPLGSRCWSASAWRRSDPAQAVGRSMGDDRERCTVNRCRAGLYVGWPQREIRYQRSGWIRRVRRSVLPRGWNTTQSKALSAFFLASKGRNVRSLISTGPLLPSIHFSMTVHFAHQTRRKSLRLNIQ